MAPEEDTVCEIELVVSVAEVLLFEVDDGDVLEMFVLGPLFEGARLEDDEADESVVPEDAAFDEIELVNPKSKC